MRTAIYPGTFDPITLGHIDVIKKSLKIVDRLIIATTDNINKEYFFSIEERLKIIQSALFTDLKLNKKKIKVISFNNLTINLCKKYNASIIIRGLRAVSDFEYEFQLAGMNKKLNNTIETIFLMSDIENQIISSNFVKDMIMKLEKGNVVIELFSDIAPNHVKRFKKLSDDGKYDNVIFHRVIDGFMAQTGDIKFGKTDSKDFNLSLVGTGGSELPNVDAEFSDVAHVRGTLSAARSADPNSFNSQFFICFDSAPHLDRQYSAFGKVVKGMEFIDQLKKGEGANGLVDNPDKIISIRSK